VTESAKKRKKYRSVKSHIPCTMKMPGPCPEKPKNTGDEDDWHPPTPPPVLMRVPAPLPPTYKVVQKEDEDSPCGNMKFSSCIIEIKNKEKCVEDEKEEEEEAQEQEQEQEAEEEECEDGYLDEGQGDADGEAAAEGEEPAADE